MQRAGVNTATQTVYPPLSPATLQLRLPLKIRRWLARDAYAKARHVADVSRPDKLSRQALKQNPDTLALHMKA